MAYHDIILAEPSLVGYWRLNEPPLATTAVGEVGGDGVYMVGTEPGHRPSPSLPSTGNCAYFVNASDTVALPAATINDPDTFRVQYTFECWVWPETPPYASNKFIFSNVPLSTPYGGFQVYLNTSARVEVQKIDGSGSGSPYTITSSATIVPQQWNYIAFVVSASPNNMQLHLGRPGNSTLLTTVASNGPKTRRNYFLNPPRIGNKNSSPFHGYIDEVAFYSTALSQPTLQEHYEAGLAKYANPTFHSYII